MVEPSGDFGDIKGQGHRRRLRTKATGHFEKEDGVNGDFNEYPASGGGINVPLAITLLVAILMKRCQLKPVFRKLVRREMQGRGARKWALQRRLAEDI